MSRTGSPLLFRRRVNNPDRVIARAIGIDQASHRGGVGQRQDRAWFRDGRTNRYFDITAAVRCRDDDSFARPPRP